MTIFTLGIRVLCRDAEWLVTRAESASHNSDQHVAYCVVSDDLTRGIRLLFSRS